MGNVVNFKRDIATKETVDMKGVAEILGLKYHTARNKILKSGLGFIDYGGKRVWIKEDIMDYKRKHYIGA